MAVAVNPRDQHHAPGGIEVDIRIALGREHRVHALEDIGVVEVVLKEGGLDQRRLLVGGDQDAGDAGGVAGAILHGRRLGLRRRNLVGHHRLGTEAGWRRPNHANFLARDRSQGDMVDTRHQVELARDPPDPRQRLRCVDRALLDLEQDFDCGRFTEALVAFENVGDAVVRGNQIGNRGLRLETVRDTHDADGKKSRQRQVYDDDLPSPVKQKIGSPLTHRQHSEIDRLPFAASVPSDQTRPLEVKLDYGVSISRAHRT